MQMKSTALLWGVLLSAGTLFAQAPAADQQQTAPQPSTAQTQPHRAMNRGGQGLWLSKSLNLSSDQQAQIKSILDEQRQQIQALRADSSLSAQERFTKAQAIRQENKTKIGALLSDEQKQQLKQMQGMGQARMMQRRLNLNQDQTAQIQTILADRRQQMEALRADSSLSDQDRRAQAQAIQQDSKSKIEALLNDTQKQQFEQMLAARKAHRQQMRRQPQTQPQSQPNA